MGKKILLIILLFLLTILVANQAQAAVSSGNPYYYNVEIKDVFTNNEKSTITNINITEIFSTEEDGSHPYAILTKKNTLLQPTKIDIDAKGNRIATFKIPQLKPGETIEVGEKYYYQGATKNYKINTSKVSSDYSGLSFAQTYLAPSFHIESDNQSIIEYARQIVDQESNPLQKARKIYGFVNKYITYDASEFSNKGALYGLTTARGVCYEYSTLMVALLRSSGVPARMVQGYKVDYHNITKMPKLADGRINLVDSAHAWVEFYLPGIGWIPSEPTINYTLNGRKQIAWDYFTNIDSPLYVPMNIDIKMESKWTSYGRLTVNRVEAMELNPQDFTAPTVNPKEIEAPAKVNNEINLQKNNANPSAIIKKFIALNSSFLFLLIPVTIITWFVYHRT